MAECRYEYVFVYAACVEPSRATDNYVSFLFIASGTFSVFLYSTIYARYNKHVQSLNKICEAFKVKNDSKTKNEQSAQNLNVHKMK